MWQMSCESNSRLSITCFRSAASSNSPPCTACACRTQGQRRQPQTKPKLNY
jgi:hypothetical protein